MIIPSDAEIHLIRFVKAKFPAATVATDIPAKWDWMSPAGQLIVITIVGGNGIRNHGFDHVRVTFEVYDPNVDTASMTVRRLYGALREWQYESPGVAFRGTILRPVYRPRGGGGDEPAFTPGYWFTIEITFRAEEISSAL